MSLLEQFAVDELLQGLSLGEKALGSFYVAILGMSITFLALIVLMGSLFVMSKLVNPGSGRGKRPVEPELPLPLFPERHAPGELLPLVLAAAAWAAVGSPVRIIRVRPIKREPDDTPAWARAGRIEQVSAGEGIW